ncbi:Uroporphyrinogen-III C-methyltransferase [termite gut metagenome]|uniref:uroporphyrinogen-III C-methyltransferase n=1 Tax=termite gut metagenome TaxID=433724 RepID=A0A5J4T3F8_9ZZZZ
MQILSQRSMDLLTVTARNSLLSQFQVEEVFSFFPSLKYRIVPLETFGDKNKHISLMDTVAPDFFTRELDEILINNDADVAVHSAKDIPYPMPVELELFALFEAWDKTDSLVSKNKLTLAQLPVKARVGTSSVVRKAELLSYRPDLEVVGIRGTIEERIAQVDNGTIDALIVATCALKRLGMEHRIADTLPFKTHPLQGNLAVVGRKDREDVKALFSSKDVRKNYGKVVLVGFGPGDPDLLTLKGDKALAKADIIFHDDLLDKQFLTRYPAEKIYVGKRKDTHRYCQDEINELVYQAAISGKNVVRLKGGDPMIFAHGREEIDYLQSRFVEVEVVPGISSGIALAAYTHIPLTHRGMASSVAFVTGHSAKETQTPDADTLVYYMGGANISAIARKLIAAGRKEDTPAALIHNVSLPNQKTYYSSLKELQYSIIKYPTPILLITGSVVSFENRVSCKQKVLLTGTSRKEYEDYGDITHTPLIRIHKIENNERLYAALRTIGTFDRIIFTSRYAVRYFFEVWHELKLDLKAFSNVKIVSVGKTTSAELGKHQIYPDIESETESAEGLINYFKEAGTQNERILLPRSDIGLKSLSEELARLGNHVEDIPVYTNTVNNDVEKINPALFQKIVFTSPSCVDAFMQIYGEIPVGVQLIAKGETTERRLKSQSNETIY